MKKKLSQKKKKKSICYKLISREGGLSSFTMGGSFPMGVWFAFDIVICKRLHSCRDFIVIWWGCSLVPLEVTSFALFQSQRNVTEWLSVS